MRQIAVALLVIASAAGPSAIAAQGTPPPGARQPGAMPQAAGQITGMVVNAANGEPLYSASVEIRRPGNNALVTGAITGQNGAFRIDGLRPGQYAVRITALGFATQIRTVSITPAALQAQLGEVRLGASAVELEGLTVTTEGRAASLAPDRNTYHVQDMPAATGGTASDVLRNVPAVEVDIDGKVSLRGNENVVVQINGRPSPMRGEQLGAFLAQLPANMVSQVEVIPNPSAKYDPEGMAGIVNIVLRENTDLGVSGGFTVGGGTTGQVNLSGNVGYQKGPLTLFANYGFMRDEREITGFLYRENRYLDPLTFLEQDTEGAFSPLSHSLNLSGEYKLGRRDAISSNLVFSNRASERENLAVYREMDLGRDITGRYRRLTEADDDDLTLDYALTYKHTIQPRRHEFSTELRFTRSEDEDLGRITQQVLLPDGTGANDIPLLETQESGELTRNWALQADYTRPLGSVTRLETGYKGTLRQLDNDFDAAFFSYDRNAYVPDLAQSNEFVFDEQVHAVYGVASGSAGKFDLQGGVRLERALTEFDLATTGEAFENDYSSFFPSGLVAYNLSDSRQVKASYSKRVERPRTRMLNPFGRFEDPLNVFRGNPFLKPEYTHAFELGYQQSGDVGTLQVTPFFRHTTDAVRRIVTIDNEGVATTTFANVATSDSYGLDVNGSLRLGRVSGFGGLSAFQQVSDGSNLGEDFSSNAFGWSARANATWRVNPTLDVQGFYMYRAPMDVERGRISSRSMLNLALRQKVLNDKASVSLRVVDPFNTMRMSFQTTDERFYQLSERQFGAWGVFLSFSWNFGQQPRIRQRSTERQEAPDDEMIP